VTLRPITTSYRRQICGPLSSRGHYVLEVFSTVVGVAQAKLLFVVRLDVSPKAAIALTQGNSGVYFDWGPDAGHCQVNVRAHLQRHSFLRYLTKHLKNGAIPCGPNRLVINHPMRLRFRRLGTFHIGAVGALAPLERAYRLFQASTNWLCIPILNVPTGSACHVIIFV
jgi:hypothetical protein